MLNYDKERNEVLIHGCDDCPFNEDDYPLGLCYLLNEVTFKNLDAFEPVPKKFPDNCPLNDPNFKLTRIKVEE